MVLSSEAQKVGDVRSQYTPVSLGHLVQVVINFIRRLLKRVAATQTQSADPGQLQTIRSHYQENGDLYGQYELKFGIYKWH
jgi:hypothetical protein